MPINLMAKRKIKRANNYMKKQGKYQDWYLETQKKDN
jgi:hypothetical protein